MFENIPNNSDWVKIDLLLKGWSKDKKYVITTKNNEKLLLRISDISLYDKKKKQFELLKQIDKLGINASRPIDFGVLNHQEIYMLLSYLEGVSAEKEVAKLSDLDAYKLGIEAGKILRKLHNLKIDFEKEEWGELYYEKIKRKIEVLKRSKVDIPQKEMLIEYINKNIHLVEDRPLLFSHGDFHLGNMIIKEGKLGIIDFDKSETADPYDDFKPFCWNCFVNEYFETGLINGYFDNKIPNDFFEVLALYAAESLISHLPWALNFGEEEVKTAYKVLDSTLKWYDNFNLKIPTWYKGLINV